MLKKKLKFIVPFLVIFLALALPIVNATDENANGIMPISADQKNTENNTAEGTKAENNSTDAENENNQISDSSTSSQEETLKKADQFLTGSDITVDYMVDGNIFIFADQVNISSNIGGDAFIIANSVEITNTGYIFGNLFVLSPNLTISGRVYDVYALSKTTNITGAIYRDLKISSDSLTLTGAVGRNAFVEGSNIILEQTNNSENNEENTISAKGMIYGDFNYTSKAEISIPEGSVTGNVNFTQESTSHKNSVENYLYSLGSIILLAIVVWLLCLWLAPKFLDNMPELITKKLPYVIALGILAPIVILTVSILLLFINIASAISLLLFAILFILFAISTSIFIITINNLICKKLKIQKNIGIFGMLIVTAAILWGLGLIPYIGTIIGFIGIIVGFGTLTSHLIFKKNMTIDNK